VVGMCQDGLYLLFLGFRGDGISQLLGEGWTAGVCEICKGIIETAGSILF
jgi:hypothetical protein